MHALKQLPPSADTNNASHVVEEQSMLAEEYVPRSCDFHVFLIKDSSSYAGQPTLIALHRTVTASLCNLIDQSIMKFSR